MLFLLGGPAPFIFMDVDHINHTFYHILVIMQAKNCNFYLELHVPDLAIYSIGPNHPVLMTKIPFQPKSVYYHG